jgi:hypothetical protein
MESHLVEMEGGHMEQKDYMNQVRSCPIGTRDFFVVQNSIIRRAAHSGDLE